MGVANNAAVNILASAFWNRYLCIPFGYTPRTGHDCLAFEDAVTFPGGVSRCYLKCLILNRQHSFTLKKIAFIALFDHHCTLSFLFLLELTTQHLFVFRECLWALNGWLLSCLEISLFRLHNA